MFCAELQTAVLNGSAGVQLSAALTACLVERVSNPVLLYVVMVLQDGAVQTLIMKVRDYTVYSLPLPVDRTVLIKFWILQHFVGPYFVS